MTTEDPIAWLREREQAHWVTDGRCVICGERHPCQTRKDIRALIQAHEALVAVRHDLWCQKIKHEGDNRAWNARLIHAEEQTRAAITAIERMSHDA